LIAGDELKRGVKDLWDYISHLSVHMHALIAIQAKRMKVLIKTAAVLKGSEKFEIVLKKK